MGCCAASASRYSTSARRRSRQRRYVPPAGRDDAGPPEAAELVADFPDEQTARSAVEVLRSWHRPCDDRLGSYERHEVGPLEP